MDFTKENISLIISIISVIISAFTSVFVYHKNKRKDIAYKRIFNVYEPVFNILEKYFFKYNTTYNFNTAITEVHNIINQNRVLAGYDLYDKFISLCSVLKDEQKTFTYKSNTYNGFCSFFMNKYNKLCKDAAVPHITLKYRLSQKVYTKFGKIRLYIAHFTINFFTSFLISLGMSMSAIILLYLLTSFMKN